MKMTQEERRARDAEICQRYLSGLSLAESGRPFGIGRQRVKQIVQAAGVWRAAKKTNGRDEFLGVNISEEDKQALREEAARRGLSMSALTADLIRDMLAERNGDPSTA